MNTEIFRKAEELVELLKAKNLKIATAESCTGGMVSSYITAVSGASQVFEMGLVTYSNRIKSQKLGVKVETLEKLGAVSRETAAQMAENVRKTADSDIGLSVTGVAGPSGQDGYNAGVVFIGISDKSNTEVKKLEIEPRDRNFVRESATLILLETALSRINNQNI